MALEDNREEVQMSTNDLVVVILFVGAIISIGLIMSRLSAIAKVQAESTEKLADMIHKQNLMIGEIKNVIGFFAKAKGAN